MMRIHTRWSVGLALTLLPAAAAAQDRPNTAPWKDSFYPYLTSLANNFPLLMIHFEERKAADYYARTPYAGLLTLDVGASTAGSRQAVAEFRAPLLWHNWRLAARAGAIRAARFGYYGLGNGTSYNENLVTDRQPYYYRAKRSRYLSEVELSRNVVGPVFLSGAFGLEHSKLSDLPLPSVFRTDQGSQDVTDDDTRGRATLVVDTRDNEFDTKNGFFAQGSVTRGSGGGSYTRVSADLRGYVTIREGTVLAARVAGSNLSSKAPLNARFEMPVWEGEIPVLGGTNSNRGLPFERLAGRGVLFGQAEVRHDLLNLGDLGAFTLFAFFDAGRVFEQESFRLTTRQMKVGAGGGLAIRILRFTIWTFNFGGGPDGFQFSAGSGWAF